MLVQKIEKLDLKRTMDSFLVWSAISESLSRSRIKMEKRFSRPRSRLTPAHHIVVKHGNVGSWAGGSIAR